jgi:hypothetical protein
VRHPVVAFEPLGPRAAVVLAHSASWRSAMPAVTSAVSYSAVQSHRSHLELRKTDPQTAVTQDQRLAIEFRAR